jgi:hypothetical protein
MLVVAGRVHRKHNTVALDFLPNNSDGHVLRTPIALQCPASGSNSVSARTRTSSKVQVLPLEQSTAGSEQPLVTLRVQFGLYYACTA